MCVCVVFNVCTCLMLRGVNLISAASSDIFRDGPLVRRMTASTELNQLRSLTGQNTLPLANPSNPSDPKKTCFDQDTLQGLNRQRIPQHPPSPRPAPAGCKRRPRRLWTSSVKRPETDRAAFPKTNKVTNRSPKSSSGEVRIRLLFVFCSLFLGNPPPKKKKKAPS